MGKSREAEGSERSEEGADGKGARTGGGRWRRRKHKEKTEQEEEQARQEEGQGRVKKIRKSVGRYWRILRRGRGLRRGSQNGSNSVWQECLLRVVVSPVILWRACVFKSSKGMLDFGECF